MIYVYICIINFTYLFSKGKNSMRDELKDEIQKEEKTFNILLIAVLSPILLGAVVITIYLLN